MERKEAEVNITEWGYERVIANGSYCGKCLFILRHHRTKPKYHATKESTFFIESGKVSVYHKHVDMLDVKSAVGPDVAEFKETKLNEGDSFEMFPYIVYFIVAFRDSKIFECSTHHDDSDATILEW